jgi:hypothetical protein
MNPLRWWSYLWNCCAFGWVGPGLPGYTCPLCGGRHPERRHLTLEARGDAWATMSERTRYITVRLTEKEAEALLKMARSGDYNNDGGDTPEIQIPSNRAEQKIREALWAAREKRETKPVATTP